MKKKSLANYDDFKHLGKYEFFKIGFERGSKQIVFSLKKNKRLLSWAARPIDISNGDVCESNSFLLFGEGGLHGMVLRQGEERFRVVPRQKTRRFPPRRGRSKRKR